MATLLDKRAEKVRFAAGEQAKRNLATRLAAQKKRIAESKAKEKKRADEVRANGVKQVDIFRKKEAAAEAAAQAQKAADEPRAEQAPKTDGPLAGRVIGAIDKTKLDGNVTAVEEIKTALVLAVAAIAEARDFWGGIYDTYSHVDDNINGAGDRIVTVQVLLDTMNVVAAAIDLDVAKIFRARKGE